MLTFLIKLLKALNSENSVKQMAFAISLGCLWGLSPLTSLQGIMTLLIVLTVKANLATFLLSGGVFSGLLALNVAGISSLGEYVLTHPALESVFTSLYQFSLFKVAQLHYTTTLGALIIASILFIPLYFISKVLIEKYRVTIKRVFEKFKIVKALKASNFYRLYQSMTS